ncbi:serine/threonine-protein kinase [Streptomyces sp. NPDC101213]|uniref:serine/threonine-protein kinase n=1 Tax=Streptomyces sp. NPDC101213 TaxID=3366130 RepID=UPI00381A1A17
MGEVFAARYELADPIGRGGVGAVWRAWDHRRRRYVAAKVLQQSDAHALLRFVREQALRIDHPHVLAPASWAADDDKVLFTMDLVTGGSLVHLVGDYGPLPAPFVCTLLDQLLSGLSAVHAEGVVHRDIKPANILLEATGTARPRLRLSDFGIAMRLGEPRLTETNLVVGTPGYLAPEQMMGADPDFPADLFAVGLVALYLLEGAKPDAKALLQYFAEHGTPGAPKGVPDSLWQVVATLLQPDPQARFRTATGARKALAAAAELLPEPGPDDEQIEIFDQLGPLPEGFGPQGPSKPAPGVAGTSSSPGRTPARRDATGSAPGGPGPDPLPAWPGTGSVPSGTPAPPAAPLPGPPAAPPPMPPRWPPVPQAGPGPAAGAVPHGRGADDAVPPPSGPSGPPDSSGLPGGPGGGGFPAADAPPHVLDAGDPRQRRDASSTGPVHSPSDTGSFPLPPPPSPPPHPGTGTGSGHAPLRGAPSESTFVLPPRPPSARRADTSTASYTAQDPRVPPPAGPAPGPREPVRRGHRRVKAARRPGPPARVALPLLLLALACYAVGFWALARI